MGNTSFYVKNAQQWYLKNYDYSWYIWFNYLLYLPAKERYTEVRI